MPEGDTVWRTARTLAQALEGAILIRTDFRVPALATVDLAGQQVVESLSRGKHLLLRIGESHTLHTHLKMEGSWHLYRPETRWRRPAEQARVVLQTPRWLAVGFSLGIVELLPRDQEDKAVGHLGPDLLGPDWNPKEARRRLLRDLERPIGDALLDQRIMAGIGNLYRSELLFLSGRNPHTPVGAIAEVDQLVRRAKAVLEANKERSLQSTTGQLRHGHRHWVYDRAGQPCRRCDATILSAKTGEPGKERTVFWCPTCQPQY